MAYVHQETPSEAVDPKTLPPLPLPSGITSRFIDTIPHGLIFHILESLPTKPTPSTKLILLIHGFPELAFSWRYVLPLLSSAGYHAVAFDQRGFGRTHSPTPLPQESFRPVSLIKDTLALVSALGYTSVSAVVGHDFGAITAHLCALARPDIFKSLVLMSHPTKGVPTLPFATSRSHSSPQQQPTPPQSTKFDIHASLASLSPPRRHYKWYYCTPPSNNSMTYPVGPPLHSFLRGYFHLKSADWPHNCPHKLASWTAEELAKMPHYYIMDANLNMRENVAADMAATTKPEEVAELCSRWLPDKDLAVYVQEYSRTTFLGGLNWYRVQTQPAIAADTEMFSGMKIKVPMAFVVGEKDWGMYQEPGALEAMEEGKSVEGGSYRGTRVVRGAGHWVQQEQAGRSVEEILRVAGEVDAKAGKERVSLH